MNCVETRKKKSFETLEYLASNANFSLQLHPNFLSRNKFAPAENSFWSEKRTTEGGVQPLERAARGGSAGGRGAELRLRATFDVGAGFWDKKHSVELDVFTEAGFGTFKQKLDMGSLCDDRVKQACV